MAPRICLLIPAFNAADTIEEIINGCKKYLSDIIVVDDGSGDSTSLISQTSGATVLKHEINRGKGIALKTGFEYALSRGYDAVITIDADGQHNPSDIPLFVKKYQEDAPHIIIGSRLGHKEKIPKYRYYSNLIGAFFISGAAGQAIEDSQSGYRLYSKKVIEGIPLKSSGFETETEILIKAGRKGYKIASIPIGISYKDITSHYRLLKDTWRIARLVASSIFW